MINLQHISRTAIRGLGVVIFAGLAFSPAFAQTPAKKPAAKPAAAAPVQAQAPAATPPAPAAPAAPAAGQPAPGTPDPMAGDWKITWLDKGNQQTIMKITDLQHAPNGLGVAGTMALPDGKNCKMNGAFLARIFGMYPSGIDVGGMPIGGYDRFTGDCDGTQVILDMFDVSPNPNNARLIGRATVGAPNAPAQPQQIVLITR